MDWYVWTYDNMELMKFFKNGIFEPMNYKLPGIYKFYSTIINACFEYLKEINNEYEMKNRIILVLWFLVMVPPSSIKICSIQQWIIFNTIFTCTIYIGRVLEHVHLYGEHGRGVLQKNTALSNDPNPKGLKLIFSVFNTPPLTPMFHHQV